MLRGLLPGHTPALITVISPASLPAAEQFTDDAGEGNLELLVCHHVDYRIQCGVEITCNDHLFIRKNIFHGNYIISTIFIKLTRSYNTHKS